MRPSTVFVLAVSTLMVACSPVAPTRTDFENVIAPPGGSASHRGLGAPADLSGAWIWSRVDQITMPAWVAEQLAGIEPEGPVTHARCEGSGTMTLTQQGASFEGTALQTTQECRTRGGKGFTSPGSAAPIQITGGRITGAAIRFDLATPMVIPCPYQAVITAMRDGTAVALSGTGRCLLPGHPQSESPFVLDPPPGGTSKVLTWTATRP